MKLKADANGNARFFSIKLGLKEHFDPKEIEMLCAQTVPGLIPPVSVQGRKNNVLQYDITPYSTLAFYLTCILSREQLAEVFLQVIDLLQRMQQVYLNYKNLVLEPDRIYVQLQDQTLHFIYLPLQDSRREASQPDFFRLLIGKAARSTYEQAAFLDACTNWLGRPGPFLLPEFDRFIREQTGVTAGAGAGAPAYAAAGVGAQQYAASQPGAVAGGYTAAQAGAAAGYAAAGVAAQPGGAQYAAPQPGTATAGYGAPGAPAQRFVSPMAKQPSQSAPIPPAQPAVQPAAEPGGTVMLGEQPGGTIMLGESEDPAPKTRYFLERLQTGETVELTHFPFLVGTEAGSVSYCVRGNAAVSRRHAEFSLENGVCMLTDRRSTNKTYLNDCALVPLTPQPLADGDEIRLGNEKFKFVRRE